MDYQLIYTLVGKIPAGKVATYGQVATLAGRPGCARQVGYALSASTPIIAIPWHRVVNASGGISSRGDPDKVYFQRLLLEQEGIQFDTKGCIDLKRFLWNSGN